MFVQMFLCNKRYTQQTQNICITFVQCRPNVFDVGPTLYKCYTNVLCLLGNNVFFVDMDPCDDNPCHGEGSTCSIRKNGHFKCDCGPGLKGETCEGGT